MTQPTSNSFVLNPPQNENILKPYAPSALLGALVTGIVAIWNPIAAAGVGTYTVTEIGVNVLADCIGISKENTLLRIMRSVVSIFGGIAAGFAVMSALGATITFSPVLIASLVALGTIIILCDLFTAAQRQ